MEENPVPPREVHLVPRVAQVLEQVVQVVLVVELVARVVALRVYLERVELVAALLAHLPQTRNCTRH